MPERLPLSTSPSHASGGGPSLSPQGRRGPRLPGEILANSEVITSRISSEKSSAFPKPNAWRPTSAFRWRRLASLAWITPRRGQSVDSPTRLRGGGDNRCDYPLLDGSSIPNDIVKLTNSSCYGIVADTAI